MVDVRYPAVAGSFYPEDPILLKHQLTEFFTLASGQVDKKRYRDSLGIISPHAGYVYSGWVAAYGYVAAGDRLREVSTVILLGPNHTGLGSPISLSKRIWMTPLGNLHPDDEIIGRLTGLGIPIDESAHDQEHSIEVQLPFIQHVNPSVRIVPICMMAQDRNTVEDLSDKLLKVLSENDRDVFFIASSDFSHYVPSDVGKRIDLPLIESLTRCDVDEFYERKITSGATPCGYGPMSVLAKLADHLGYSGELLRFASSGDVNGDYRNVVDYASIIYYKPHESSEG